MPVTADSFTTSISFDSDLNIHTKLFVPKKQNEMDFPLGPPYFHCSLL